MTKQHAAAAPAPPPLADDGLTLDRSSDQNAFTVLAVAFVEAFNDRDADALVALAHPRIVFRPTTLVGQRRTYHGHEGLRRWVAEIDATGADFQVHIREIRPLRPSGFLVLSKLRVGDELITDSAMIASVHQGEIIEAHGYLSDEQMLADLDLIPHAPRLPL
ncbi:MAG: nuclear transport factor 2 family protein [Actinobacteria bacterium]|nr:nuclear transport factor 2 family protein [Actinomycetota bacterium]